MATTDGLNSALSFVDKKENPWGAISTDTLDLVTEYNQECLFELTDLAPSDYVPSKEISTTVDFTRCGIANSKRERYQAYNA